jgi:hypothetical protein
LTATVSGRFTFVRSASDRALDSGSGIALAMRSGRSPPKGDRSRQDRPTARERAALSPYSRLPAGRPTDLAVGARAKVRGRGSNAVRRTPWVERRMSNGVGRSVYVERRMSNGVGRSVYVERRMSNGVGRSVYVERRMSNAVRRSAWVERCMSNGEFRALRRADHIRRGSLGVCRT